MEPLVACMITIFTSLVLALASYHTGLLTKGGSLAASVIGICIGLLGAVSWLLLLALFTIIGFAVTLVGFRKKKRRGLQEGKHGERGYKNILGVAIPPLIVSIANFLFPGHDAVMSIAFISTVAVAAADTAGSELGVRDSKVRLITTFKPVDPGIDGGISLLGTLMSIAASAVISFTGYSVIFNSIGPAFLIPMLCGFVGCLADSYLGATVESRGLISKYTNNCITGVLGAVLAVAICICL